MQRERIIENLLILPLSFLIFQVHGSQFITKVLSSSTLDQVDRPRYIEMVKRIVLDHKLSGVPAYRRLIEDLGLPIPPPPGGQLAGGQQGGQDSFGGDAGFSSPYADQSMLLNQMHRQGLGGPLPPLGGGGMSQSMSVPGGLAPSYFGRSPSSDAFNPYGSPPSSYQQSPLQAMPHSSSVNSNLGYSPVRGPPPQQRMPPMTPRSAAREGGYGSPFGSHPNLQSHQNGIGGHFALSPQRNGYPAMGYSGFIPPPPPQQQQQQSPYGY